MHDPSDPAAEVRLTHVFDAPRELVFAAWTDPDQVPRWWAPPGFEIPRRSVAIELAVGGRFDFEMVAADGSASYPYRGEIAELVVPELLVIRTAPIDEAGIAATITRVALAADGDRTHMTLTSGPYTDEMRQQAAAGWAAGIVSLERWLGERAPQRERQRPRDDDPPA